MRDELTPPILCFVTCDTSQTYFSIVLGFSPNKTTVKMSQKNPANKDTDLYTFQDQDNTQMHMYMPTYAFVNFFAICRLPS